MPGIRVPDSQYEAPTPTPEKAQVPLAKQPVANANDFGAAQAEAGEQAGQKVAGAAIDFADRMIQVKQWNQQSQMYDDKESYRAFMEQRANDLTTHEVSDPKTGEVRQVPNGWNNITDQRDLGSVSQLVSQAQAEGRKLYGPQANVTLLPVAKMYERYLGGIDGVYNDQATKHIVDQTKQNTVAGYKSAFGKAMQATDFPNSLSYYNNVHDVGSHKLVGESVAMGASLSPKELQGMQKDMFPDAMNKYFNHQIWEGKMTPEQANQDLDNTVGKLKDGQDYESGDVDQIRQGIAKSNDAYQTQVKLGNEQQERDTTGKVLSNLSLYSGKNNSAIATSGIDDKLIEPLTNAMQNVETQRGEDKPGFFGIGGSKKLDTVPITKENLGIDLDADDAKESKQAADYTIGMANSHTYPEARDVLVKAITSGKLDKEQLNVYTRTLALVSQYLPTATESAQGKTVDPKGVPVLGAYKDVMDFGQKANLPDLSHSKQFLDNQDKGMAPADNVADVKTTAVNKMFPQTVASGAKPIENSRRTGRLFIGRDADTSGYPMVFDYKTMTANNNDQYGKAQ